MGRAVSSAPVPVFVLDSRAGGSHVAQASIHVSTQHRCDAARECSWFALPQACFFTGLRTAVSLLHLPLQSHGLPDGGCLPTLLCPQLLKQEHRAHFGCPGPTTADHVLLRSFLHLRGGDDSTEGAGPPPLPSSLACEGADESTPGSKLRGVNDLLTSSEIQT